MSIDISKNVFNFESQSNDQEVVHTKYHTHFHVLNVVSKSKIMYEKMNGKILGKKIKKVYSMNTKLLFYA